MNGQAYTINSEHTLKCFIEHVTKQWHEKKWMQCTFNYDKTRSLKQNSALHVYLGMLAEELNSAGHSLVIKINGKETDVDWNMELVKDLM